MHLIRPGSAPSEGEPEAAAVPALLPLPTVAAEVRSPPTTEGAGREGGGARLRPPRPPRQPRSDGGAAAGPSDRKENLKAGNEKDNFSATFVRKHSEYYFTT